LDFKFRISTIQRSTTNSNYRLHKKRKCSWCKRRWRRTPQHRATILLSGTFKYSSTQQNHYLESASTLCKMLRIFLLVLAVESLSALPTSGPTAQPPTTTKPSSMPPTTRPSDMPSEVLPTSVPKYEPSTYWMTETMKPSSMPPTVHVHSNMPAEVLPTSVPTPFPPTAPTAGPMLKKCLAGYYRSTPKKCLPCPMGQWSAAGASVCISCPAGTHSSNHLSCTDCKPGEYSEANWRECEFCGVGTVSKAKASKCTVCPVDTYAHHQDNECKPCEKGFYSLAKYDVCLKIGEVLID
jgi:hypothetical protein